MFRSSPGGDGNISRRFIPILLGLAGLYAYSLPLRAQTPLQPIVTQPVTTAASDSTQKVDPGETFEPGQVVAVVGGEPLFLAEMLLEVNQIMDKVMANAPDNVRQRERRDLIFILARRKYVDQKLMMVYAKRALPENVTWDQLLEQAGADFDDKALPKLLEKSEVENATMYDAMLRSKGSSLRQVKRSWAEDQLVRYFNFQKIDMDPEISHQEMLDYYHAHQDDFSHIAKVKWEEIMVRFDKFESRDAALQEIVKLGNEVAYGASLEAVAKRSSQGFTAHRGGQYDWTDKGSLANKKLEHELFQLPVGYLSDLIETELGVHIVRVLERNEATITPFRDAQVEIKEQLLNQKREALIGEHLDKLRLEIPVEILWKPNSPKLAEEMGNQ